MQKVSMMGEFQTRLGFIYNKLNGNGNKYKAMGKELIFRAVDNDVHVLLDDKSIRFQKVGNVLMLQNVTIKNIDTIEDYYIEVVNKIYDRFI